MKLLSARELHQLKPGDKVHYFNGRDMVKFYFVGKTPKCENLLIFANGSDVRSFWVSTTEYLVYHFYSGEYDSKFVGNLIIEALKKDITVVEKIYLKKT